MLWETWTAHLLNFGCSSKEGLAGTGSEWKGGHGHSMTDSGYRPDVGSDRAEGVVGRG